MNYQQVFLAWHSSYLLGCHTCVCVCVCVLLGATMWSTFLVSSLHSLNNAVSQRSVRGPLLFFMNNHSFSDLILFHYYIQICPNDTPNPEYLKVQPITSNCMCTISPGISNNFLKISIPKAPFSQIQLSATFFILCDGSSIHPVIMSKNMLLS